MIGGALAIFGMHLKLDKNAVLVNAKDVMLLPWEPVILEELLVYIRSF